MTNDREFWEAKFVDTFISKVRRPRYKEALNSPKNRYKILDRLNHGPDLDFSRGRALSGNQASAEPLLERLRSLRVEPHCWLISDDPELDGVLMPLQEVAKRTLSADWGTVMICPPKPVAVYRPEASEKSLYLFV